MKKFIIGSNYSPCMHPRCIHVVSMVATPAYKHMQLDSHHKDPVKGYFYVG